MLSYRMFLLLFVCANVGVFSSVHAADVKKNAENSSFSCPVTDTLSEAEVIMAYNQIVFDVARRLALAKKMGKRETATQQEQSCLYDLLLSEKISERNRKKMIENLENAQLTFTGIRDAYKALGFLEEGEQL